jgi:hypothetical protein
MPEERRVDTDRVREAAEKLGSPGQDATPDERDGDDRDALQNELRRRRAKGDDEPAADRDG